MTECWYRLYTTLVTDALIEYSYDAALAGLSYSIETSSLGFYVTVSGYNDKLHVLLRDVLEKAKSLEVRAERLEVMKEKVCNISQPSIGIRSKFFCVDQARLGKLLPWSKLSIVGLLWTIHHERDAVDNLREITGSRL